MKKTPTIQLANSPLVVKDCTDFTNSDLAIITLYQTWAKCSPRATYGPRAAPVQPAGCRSSQVLKHLFKPKTDWISLTEQDEHQNHLLYSFLSKVDQLLIFKISQKNLFSICED